MGVFLKRYRLEIGKRQNCVDDKRSNLEKEKHTSTDEQLKVQSAIECRHWHSTYAFCAARKPQWKSHWYYLALSLFKHETPTIRLTSLFFTLPLVIPLNIGLHLYRIPCIARWTYIVPYLVLLSFFFSFDAFLPCILNKPRYLPSCEDGNPSLLCIRAHFIQKI